MYKRIKKKKKEGLGENKTHRVGRAATLLSLPLPRWFTSISPTLFAVSLCILSLVHESLLFSPFPHPWLDLFRVMEETDDLPQDSVDSAADGIENDDESNEQQELDPDQVRFCNVPSPNRLMLNFSIWNFGLKNWFCREQLSSTVRKICLLMLPKSWISILLARKLSPQTTTMMIM